MRIKALKAAFPHTIPILTGFWFLGMAYGIYMNVSGFGFLYPLIMGIVIFGGSLQFLGVSMLLAPFAPIQTLIMAFLVQARHIFYGISMLDKYKGMGWKKFYLIFGLCDETFSVNCSAEIPPDVDRGWFMFFVTLLDQIYWVMGSLAGGIVGSYLNFSTKGIEFVMTAMFVVIFMSQLKKEKNNILGLIGFGFAALCLFIFGKDNFLIPTMISIVAALTIFKRPIESAGSTGVHNE